MSQSLGEAYVKIGARLDGLERGLKDARRRTEDSANAMARAFKVVGAAWAGLNLIKTGASLVEGFFGSAMERDRAASGLTSALKITGKYNEEAEAGFRQQADELGKLPGITENQIREMQALGIQGGRSVESVESLVKTSVGLKGVFGSAEAAMKALSEELEGIPNEKLSKAIGGPLLNITDRATRLKMIFERGAGKGIEILTDQLGSASAKAENVGKTFEKLKADVGDLFVGIVADNADKIMEFLEGLRDIVPTLPAHFKILTSYIEEFAGKVADFFKPVVEAIKFISEHAGNAMKGAVSGVPASTLLGLDSAGAAATAAGISATGGGKARPDQGADVYRQQQRDDILRIQNKQAEDKIERMLAAGREEENRIVPGSDGKRLIADDVRKNSGGSVTGIQGFLDQLANAGADSAIRDQTEVLKQILEETKKANEGADGGGGKEIRFS